jgi:hypothetical protein
MNKNALLNEEYGRDDARDLNTLLHPAQAFEQPSDVSQRPRSDAEREASDPRLVGLGCVCN